MPHTFTSLLVHVIFSTKDRAPDLSPELAARLFPYMGGIVRECKGTALIINGPADHVHLRNESVSAGKLDTALSP
jgi:putative transposase